MSDLLPSRDMDAARRRAERIRIKARTITEQYESLRELLDEAERCEDHLALGYASWTAYLADLFGDEPLRLPRDERIPMSVMLTDAGVSTRAAGQILGVDHKTIVNDVRSGGEVSPPAPTGSTIATAEGVVIAQAEHIDLTTGEVLDEEPGKIIGLDGKTYTRPERTATRRRPLPDVALDAAHALTAAVARMERVFTDDRYPQNKEQVARYTRHHLPQAVKTLQRLADEITQ